MSENRPVTEWAVRTPMGYFHEFTDEYIARLVAQEQHGELLTRTVTYTPWTSVLSPASGHDPCPECNVAGGHYPTCPLTPADGGNQ